MSKLKKDCTLLISAVYHDFFTYYSGKGVTSYSPKFKYTFDNNSYDVYAIDTYSYKKLNRKFKFEESYMIYINPKKPTIICAGKRIGGLLFVIYGLLVGF